MGEEERWRKLEEIVRRVVREEVAVLAKGKKQIAFVNGKWVGITDEQLSAWKAAYGSVDIQDELNKMAAWLVSNPMGAPKNNFARFANTWLSRCQDRSAIRSIPTRSDPIPGPGRKLCAYCDAVATANFGGTWACRNHGQDALDGKPVPMMKIPVIAKNVAGDR